MQSKASTKLTAEGKNVKTSSQNNPLVSAPRLVLLIPRWTNVHWNDVVSLPQLSRSWCPYLHKKCISASWAGAPPAFLSPTLHERFPRRRRLRSAVFPHEVGHGFPRCIHRGCMVVLHRRLRFSWQLSRFVVGVLVSRPL